MFAVTRNYTGASSLIDAMEQRHTEVERLITTTPGFVSYFAVRSGDALTTFTVCDDRAGCEETSRRAAEWVRENLSDAKISPPTLSSGDVFFALSGPGVATGLGSVASHVAS